MKSIPTTKIHCNSNREGEVRTRADTFVMIFKNKDSNNDPSKYRCIGILSHSYKTLSQYLLARLEVETTSYLSDWKTGLKKKRGFRDNILVLCTIYKYTLKQDKDIYDTFIDYDTTFDSVSHKFLDQTLKKIRCLEQNPHPLPSDLQRGIYNDRSEKHKWYQGTLKRFPSQPRGDITSPLYFILAITLILKKT